MNSKKPLALLLVALLAVGMVSMFAAAPVAADHDDNTNDCEANAASSIEQGQQNVGVVGSDVDQTAASEANALIDNDALVEQTNNQAIDQDGAASSGTSVVDQDAANSASNTAYVSQCEANQDG